MQTRDFESQRVLELCPWVAEPLDHLELALKHYVFQAGATEPAEAHRQALRHLDEALTLGFRAYLLHHDEAGLPPAVREGIQTTADASYDRLLELMSRYGPAGFTRNRAHRLADAHRLRVAAETSSVEVSRSVVEFAADVAVEQFRDLFGLRVGFRHRTVEAVQAGDADDVGRLSLADAIVRVWGDARTRPTCLIAGLAVVLLGLIYLGGLAAILLIR